MQEKGATVDINWEALGAVAETIGGLGVIITLAYLSLQIRGSNRVARAQSRQSMTEFAMGISRFRAEHADRYARIAAVGEGELTPGDTEFLYWCHMQMLTYGEAYYQQFKLGLMDDSHWEGFSRWIDAYIKSRDFDAFWSREGSSFSADYAAWVNEKMG